MSSINNIQNGMPLYTAAQPSSKANTTADTTTAIPREDTFTKSGEVDLDKVNSMKAELKNNMSAFKMMVETAMKTQGRYAYNSLADLFKDLEVDEETQLQAQAAIAEDGYWGVEQTAQRILDFAMALSGGDASKIDMLQSAVLAGFDAAEEAWGGKLADICYQTKERILEGFADWKASYESAEEEAAE